MSQVDSAARLALLRERLTEHLEVLYPDTGLANLVEDLVLAMKLDQHCRDPLPHTNHWDQGDVLAITYGDSIRHDGEKPLVTLRRFLNRHMGDSLSGVHILPFFPYSSDDGFAVLDYSSVNEGLGDWQDISALANDFDLMVDLVINHCSSRGPWFENYRSGRDPGLDYFVEAEPTEDLSAVVRPRTNPLLQPVETSRGTRYVWCTFGFDQVDLNFRNPRVLVEFVRILNLYLEKGARIIRLDAVGFVWKAAGTDCLSLPETHEIVRLLRTLTEHYRPRAIIITETNIPNRENLAYFGNANEAHAVYNFSLPPLLLHTLVSGNCHHLKLWMMSMPPAQMGTTYLNFIASHDGIGLRPVEGLLDEADIAALIETMEGFGGRVSWRALDDNRSRPYEVNISLYDALKGTRDSGPDQWQIARFLCAHAIMLALEGIPAFYIHSLLATGNDHERMARLGHNRAINRHQWDAEQLESALTDPDSHHREVFGKLKSMIAIRRRQPAFHPNATQFTLHLGEQVFGFWRQSINRDQSIFALNNVSDAPQDISLKDINLIATNDWCDLVSGCVYDDLTARITLEPYQFVWISNRLPADR